MVALAIAWNDRVRPDEAGWFSHVHSALNSMGGGDGIA